MRTGPPRVEAASPEDAGAIRDLLAEAFGPTYLRFTVYQSPKAAALIRGHLLAAGTGGAHAYFVVRGEGGLLGFYAAVRRGEEFFLNYIASGGAGRGAGVGAGLLDHFEAEAARRGCRTVGLDVFRSNTDVVAWYRRHGYEECGRRYHLRVRRETAAAWPGGDLRWDPEEMASALDEEARQGGSSLRVTTEAGEARLGLIAGDTLNLLEPRGPGAVGVAGAAARALPATRRWLLMVWPDAPPAGMGAESVEEALTMRRTVRAAGGETL